MQPEGTVQTLEVPPREGSDRSGVVDSGAFVNRSHRAQMNFKNIQRGLCVYCPSFQIS